ncbi:hypothetical protein [Streptomyces sp. NBC_00470]|uniref:hypothetical protein n=1 Tax=Streptomyces sp. NBC_00470 TaxID=2975753 RepID=UPI0030E2E8F1
MALDLSPEAMPELRQDMAAWARTYAQVVWSRTHVEGSPFVLPPSLGGRVPVGRYLESPNFRRLADYHGETWETGKLDSISPVMTHLAFRSEMKSYRLTRDMLPPGARGITVWQTPIGDAESGNHLDHRDPVSGKWELDDDAIDYLNRFREAPAGIMAATWRYEPEANGVWVTFWADHTEVVASGLTGTTAQRRQAKQLMGPLGMEMEQWLPLDESLRWFHEDAGDPKGALRLTVRPRPLRGSADPELYAKAQRRMATQKPMMSQWVKTLLCTWMLRKMKVTGREVIEAPRSVQKRLARTERPEVAREMGRVEVIKLGEPIRKRAERAKAGGYTWKVQTLIGPVTRTRQYIPAWGTYDEEPRIIEPFWAGPPGAPVSGSDRVFLLSE